MRAFGQGSFPLVGTILVATRFQATRGRMLSLSAQGLTIASIVLPFACVASAEAIGWRPTLRVIAGFLLVVVLPLALLAGRAVTRPDTSTTPQVPFLTFRNGLRRRGVVRLLLVFALPPLVTTGLVVHAVSIVGQNGLDRQDAALAIATLATATAAGTLIGDVLVDRMSARFALTAMSGTFLTSSLLLLVPSSGVTFLAYCVLGLANGAYVTANGTLWAETYGVKNLGRLQSIAFSGQIAGAAAGPLPLAIAFSISGDYLAGLLFMAILSVFTLVLGWIWASDPVLSGQRSNPADPTPRVNRGT